MTPEKKAIRLSLNNSLLTCKPKIPYKNPNVNNNKGVVVQEGDTCYYYNLFNQYYVNTGYTFTAQDIEEYEGYMRDFGMVLWKTPEEKKRAKPFQAFMVFCHFMNEVKKHPKKVIPYHFDYLKHWERINQIRDMGFATSMARCDSTEYSLDLVDLVIEKENYKIDRDKNGKITWGHQETIKANGESLAVLGTREAWFDDYAIKDRKLFKKLVENGVIIKDCFFACPTLV
jgi:hypothetical protein